MKRFRLEYSDQNERFASCLPKAGSLVGRFADTSGVTDWHLLSLDEPIAYQMSAGEPFTLESPEIKHVLVRSRWAGHELVDPAGTSVFILLVHPSQLPLKSPLRVQEYHFVAWGMCYPIHVCNRGHR
jgi:hypothetical protein